jgi:erythromycin esterase-like protein
VITAVSDDLRTASRPVDQLLELVGDARLVLLGEASHGTHEFYAMRADLTRRLIAERGFRGVAVEADWPAAARVNTYVHGLGDDADAEAALGGFERFPRWMWRNQVVLDLVEWLRRDGAGAGFYGLDLYSLRDSMHAVIEYLDGVDPDAAQRARSRYACFDHFDEQAYGYVTEREGRDSCEEEAVEQLREMLGGVGDRAVTPGTVSADAHFMAVQNARLAADAERYYRAMYRGRATAWNLRDTHMADTLDALDEHLGHAGIVVWAHNSHLGDARATSLQWEHGELNLGQLGRERHGDRTCLVGFTTYEGTVTAARDWEAAPERRDVQPGLEGSLERRLHDSGVTCGAIDLRGGLLGEEQLERMIGVIYRPESERSSHYVLARPAKQFDVVVHVDASSALQPLDPWAGPAAGPPDTFPFGV